MGLSMGSRHRGATAWQRPGSHAVTVRGFPVSPATGSGCRHPLPPSIIFTATLVFTAGDRTYPSCKMSLSEEPGNVLGSVGGGIRKD